MNRRPGRVIWLLLIAAVLVSVVVAVLFIKSAMEENDLDPPAPQLATQTPTTDLLPASPTAQASPPAATLAPPPGSLTDLMRYAPDRMDDGSLPLPEIATYADIEAWLSLQSQPASEINEGQLSSLALPPILANRALDPIWRATYGFSLADVNQVLAIGQSPDYVFIMRGDFDESAMTSAWADSAYQAVEFEGMTIWSAFPGDTIDLSNPASRPAMGSLNNIILLDDGTLIAAAKLSRVQDAIRVHQGNAASFAQHDDIADLLALESSESRFVTAVIAKGELIESAPTDDRRTELPVRKVGTQNHAQSTPAAPAMPQVRMCLFGLIVASAPEQTATPAATPASLPPPRLTIAMTFDDADQVEVAQIVIANRFEQGVSTTTGASWTDTFTLEEVRLTGEDGLVVLHIRAKSGTLDWLRFIDDRDFAFLTWNDDGDEDGS